MEGMKPQEGKTPIRERLLREAPHLALALLDLHEGLAVNCKEIRASSPCPGSDQERLLASRERMYKERVGVPVEEREAFRQAIKAVIGY